MESNTKRIIDELLDYVHIMRENSETDLRSIIHVLNKYKKDEKYSVYPREVVGEKDWLNYPHKQSEIEFPEDEH